MRYWLIALVVLMGCINRPVYPKLSHRTLFVVYNECPMTEAAAIEAATEEWKTKTHSIATFDIRFVETAPTHLEPTDILIKPVEADDPHVLAIEERDRNSGSGGNVLALFEYSSNTLFIVPARLTMPDDFRMVFLHELGHSLGLQHSASIDSVMYQYSLISSKHITANDIAAFCVIYGCSPRYM